MNNYTTTLIPSSTTINAYRETQITNESIPSSTLLHRLHTNERQLRTLAVVLSLTGGLAISFALGVGIMIYWYFRKCKQKRRLHDDIKNDTGPPRQQYHHQETSVVERDESEQTRRRHQEPSISIVESSDETETILPVAEHSTITQINTDSSLMSPLLSSLPLSPPVSDFSSLPVPEPSAPSAKELLYQSPSLSAYPQQRNRTSGDNDDAITSLCHDCLAPPPAYTED
ncbi:MAG: hypothetical protein EXX96DRAFT_61233 [Benjaminiella poitrasii]|nr:MAG: hypothetical protein EXX96DRAFT_61233 [Benjaminiella poitrasii]